MWYDINDENKKNGHISFFCNNYNYNYTITYTKSIMVYKIAK